MPHSTIPTTPPSPSSTSSPFPQLYVNDGPLDSSNIAQLTPTPLSTPITEIRRRYQADGYVYLKNLLPRSDILAARSAYFTTLSPSGVLAHNTTPEQGIFNPQNDPLDFPGIGAGGADANGKPCGPHPEIADLFVDLALKAHYEEWYTRDLCGHPRLKEMVSQLTGWGMERTHAVKRTLLRNNTPGNKAIGVHYDQIFLRHGEDTAVTCWVPLGDVKVEGGGLIYLENGHTLGAEIEQEFTRKAKESGMSDEEAKNAFNSNMMHGAMLSNGPAEFGKQHGRRWLVTAYEAGDVVLHNAYAVHASTMNFDKDGVIRVGTDLRFVDTSRKWDTVRQFSSAARRQ